MNPNQPITKPFMGGEEVAMIKKYLAELGSGVAVLEFGAGGSTVAFAPSVKNWYSIEHDAAWAQKTKDALALAKIDNVQIVVVPANPPTKPMYAGEYNAAYLQSFADYVMQAQKTPHFFSAALVDGRSRLACARQALELLRPGGYIFFHDFLGANRTRYRVFLKECQMVDCIVRGQTLAVFRKPL